jgi:DNA repair protein RadC
MTTTRLKQLPREHFPRERLLEKGAEALSNRELLALLIGSGSAHYDVYEIADNLLIHFGSLLSIASASVERLQKIPGIGVQKAVLLKAACSLAERLAKEKCIKSPSSSNPKELYEWLRLILIHERQEVFGCVLQDAQLRIIKFISVTKGILTQTLVHPREVFAPAIEANAYGMILVHNHPSGSLSPSMADLEVTEVLVEASKALKIAIHDHLIVSKNGYFSFKENKLIR